ncbi:MAG TPA: cortexillin II [Ruminococcaceae bacterium]|nr:cortexillin II [Oscillospiraceae bacterium]
MARGIAKSLEEKIADIQTKKIEYQTKIERYKAKILEMDEQIKELQDEEKKEKLLRLLDVIETSGRTVDEVLESVGLSCER